MLVAGLVTGVVVAALTTLVTGPAAWTDFLTVLRQTSDSIATPHNFAPGAVAYQLGLSRDAAAVLQLASMVGAGAIVVVAALRAAPVGGYLAAVTASQLVSPILWDHYLLVLLVPVAWLVARGVRSALIVPLLTPMLLSTIVPAIVYPLSLWVVLLAVFAVGIRERSGTTGRP
jgi:hypothetical protein